MEDGSGADTNLHSLGGCRRNVFYLEKGTAQPGQLDFALGCYESELKGPDRDINAGWDAINSPEVLGGQYRCCPWLHLVWWLT